MHIKDRYLNRNYETSISITNYLWILFSVHTVVYTIFFMAIMYKNIVRLKIFAFFYTFQSYTLWFTINNNNNNRYNLTLSEV